MKGEKVLPTKACARVVRGQSWERKPGVDRGQGWHGFHS